MSFGFSPSDIVFFCQIAYKLYGRLRDAGPEFAQLSDTVEGVYHTFNYLFAHAAEIIPAKLKHDEAIRMQENLRAIVQNCVSTLQDMRKTLDKYKGHLVDRSTTNVPKPKGKMGKIRREVTSNLRRLEWAGKENELNKFRETLQSHIRAIEAILSVATWWVFLSTSGGGSSRQSIASPYRKFVKLYRQTRTQEQVAWSEKSISYFLHLSQPMSRVVRWPSRLSRSNCALTNYPSRMSKNFSLSRTRSSPK
jgi:hypothetical protein